MRSTFIYPHDLLSSVQVNRHKTAINRLGWLKSGRLFSASMRLPPSILCDERMRCESECCGYNHTGDAPTTTHSKLLKVNQIRLPPGASSPQSGPGDMEAYWVGLLRDEAGCIINWINSDRESWYQIKQHSGILCAVPDYENFKQFFIFPTPIVSSDRSLNASRLKWSSSENAGKAKMGALNQIMMDLLLHFPPKGGKNPPNVSIRQCLQCGEEETQCGLFNPSCRIDQVNPQSANISTRTHVFQKQDRSDAVLDACGALYHVLS